MNKLIATMTGACLLACCSCQKGLVEYGNGDLQVRIEPGENWLHDFPLALGIQKKNAPQIAVWIEDPQGNYVSTVYVTHKIATQDWTASGGNRRKESLPVWCHARGVVYEDGLYLPTKKQPLTDAVSGATPRENFSVKVSPHGNLQRFTLKVEINHSTDFNDFYPKSAQQGEPGYSGGKGGSGQPALVYAAPIDLSSPQSQYTATLIGHSSPDGSDGRLSTELKGLSSALNIVKQITVRIQP